MEAPLGPKNQYVLLKKDLLRFSSKIIFIYFSTEKEQEKPSSSNKASNSQSSRSQSNKKLDFKSLIEKSDAARNKLKAKNENVSKGQLRVAKSVDLCSPSKSLSVKSAKTTETEKKNPTSEKPLPKKSVTEVPETTRSRSKSNKQDIKTGPKEPQSPNDKSKKSKSVELPKKKSESNNKMHQMSKSFDSKLKKNQPKPKLSKSLEIPAKKSVIDNRVLSTDEDNNCPSTSSKANPKKSKIGLYLWAEVFSEEEEKWVSIDVTKSKVHDHEDIIRQAKMNGPITYVLAWNPDGSIKDVSARYCHNFDTATRKLRVEEDWLRRLLKPFKGKRNAKDILEDKQLKKVQLEKPLPQAISE